MQTLDPTSEENITTWLTEGYDNDTKNRIRALMESDPESLNNAFYTHLEFGTGGMRGLMGDGTNRMNVYTIARATQGLANYIKKQNINQPSVLIGYDSRINSKEFASIAARVLAGNAIQVYLFDELRPTPLVSFGCRFKRCTAAIMITASHNPPEYNGYKVYWNDGAQIVPPHDTGIVDEVVRITSLKEIRKSALKDSLIEPVLKEVDDAYLESLKKLQLYKELMQEKGGDLKILYTSLHGTGITLIRPVLNEWGFTNLSFVEKQVVPDGNFPFARYPNPEEKKALEMGMDQMVEEKADILIATDPDADRVGVVALHQDKPYIFNGNQMACLCLEHILNRHTELNSLPENAAFIKTIATTELFKTICDSYNTASFDVLTGFKYVAEKIREWEQEGNPYQYIFGGEESYGYLLGTDVRDKDALSAAALISEMALVAKLKGKTLVDLLEDLYHKYGIYYEKLLSLNFPDTKEGKEKMNTALTTLRQNPPQTIGDFKVNQLDDYEVSESVNLLTGEKTPLTLAQSNVLVFWLADKSKVMIRPSGTEPKVKIYCGVSSKEFKDIPSGLAALDEKAQKLLEALKTHLS